MARARETIHRKLLIRIPKKRGAILIAKGI